MITALVILGVVYAFFILLSWLGWKMTNSTGEMRDTFQTRVSIIIPARNEEDNILHCLNSVAQQSYPKNLIEVIIVDDSSEDRTAAMVNEWIASNPLNAKLISLTANKNGKKNALNEAVKIASGELIVTTDADCVMDGQWLNSIVSSYEKNPCSMVCGMVLIMHKNNFLSAFQSLEQLGLIVIGAAGIYFSRPLLCSGANLAYTKKIFEERGGYNPSAETASGDDTALMFRIAKQNPRAIHFLKSKDAIVSTKSAATWNDFISQRKRWGSKVFYQKNFTSILAGLIVFLFHLGLIISLLLSFSGAISWQIPLILFGLKLIPEILLLSDVITFTGKKKLWKYLLLAELVYPFYLVVTILLSQTGKYTWKDRKVQ